MHFLVGNYKRVNRIISSKGRSKATNLHTSSKATILLYLRTVLRVTTVMILLYYNRLELIIQMMYSYYCT